MWPEVGLITAKTTTGSGTERVAPFRWEHATLVSG
jgi:hypothetical protein